MTSFRQAVHVVGKDLRENSVVLAIYLAIVGLATIAAVNANEVPVTPSSLLLVVSLELCGMVVVASIVQGDSPTRADAFWASRPLAPSAVLAAKVFLAVAVVLAVPVAGELAALFARHVSAGVAFGVLGETAWSYATWLILAFLVSAITKDLKAFFLVIAAIPVLLILSVFWAISSHQSTSEFDLMRTAGQHATAWGLIAVGALGSAALLIYLYRTRDTRPRTWIAGFVCAFLLAQTPGLTPSRRQSADIPASIPRTTFSVATDGTSNNSGRVVRYSLILTPDSLPPMQRLALLNGIATVQSRSGAAVRQPLDQMRLDSPFNVHALRNVTWLGSNIQVGGFGVALTKTDALQTIIDSGIVNIRVDGRMLVLVPGPADTLELRVGSAIAREGKTAVISKLNIGGGHVDVTFNVSSVPLNSLRTSPFATGDEESEIAIVNETRHEAVALSPGGGGSTTTWLVLAGVQVSTGEERFVIQPGASHDSISEDWFRGAHLVISRWVPAGSYPIHAENSNPSQPLAPPPPPR